MQRRDEATTTMATDDRRGRFRSRTNEVYCAVTFELDTIYCKYTLGGVGNVFPSIGISTRYSLTCRNNL